VNKSLGYHFYNIVLYGESIGSGPSLFLASLREKCVGGIILHSPIASGFKMIKFSRSQCHSNDLFPNSDLIRYINCPVLIIHGDKDKDVHIRHSELLFKMINDNNESKYFWIVNGGDHNNIRSHFSQ